MKKTILLILTIFSIYNPVRGQKHPVTVSVTAPTITGVYLNDFFNQTAVQPTVSITFNDYNEPSWDIYLRISIESQTVKIATMVEYKPPVPLTVIPGVILQLKGMDLFPYLAFENAVVSGAARDEIIRDGKLPEGLYTISAECFDYQTGKKISNRGIAITQMRYADVPVLLTPLRESIIIPSPMQQIHFTWAMRTAPLPGTGYILSIFEVGDISVHPSLAAAGGRMIKIFESEQVTNVSYLYGPAEPMLETGKCYIFQVRAVNEERGDIFRNHGKSEFGWFYYGYRRNGQIIAEYPPEGYGFTLRDERFFRWGAVDNRLPGQQVIYALRIYESADASSEPVYEYMTPEMSAETGSSHFTTLRFKPGQNYTWQVTGYSANEEVAQSREMHFTGPPYLEAFKAGNHVIKVIRTINNSLDSLSGEGTVQINADGTKHEVFFNNIHLERSNGELIMTHGVVYNIYKGENIPLLPADTNNPEALFIADSLIIDRYSMYLAGSIQWPFPHAVMPSGQALISSASARVNFDNYELSGIVSFDRDTSFQLIEPYGFIMHLSRNSSFALTTGSIYSASLQGQITLPALIRGFNGSRVSLPFEECQLSFIAENRPEITQKIFPVSNTQITLIPAAYTFDFSETVSPPMTPGLRWKGLWIKQHRLIIPPDADDKNQIKPLHTLSLDISADTALKHYCLISQYGISYNYQGRFGYDDRALFNTFPSFLLQIDLHLANNKVSASGVQGKMHIPFLSDTAWYLYTTQLNDNGFAPGYMNEAIEGTDLLFNPSTGEQEIRIHINRAVFERLERLNLNVDIEWTALGIAVTRMDNLLLYGNYNIGFGKANGMVPLHRQVNTRIREFNVTASHIGCGRTEQLYSIGILGPIVMSSDISGYNGPPLIRTYSIDDNPLLRRGLLDGTIVPGSGEKSSTPGGSMNYNIDTVEIARNTISSRFGNAEQIINQATALAASLAQPADTTGKGTTEDPVSVRASVSVRPGELTVAEVLFLVRLAAELLDDEKKNDTSGIGALIADLDGEQLREVYDYLTGATNLLNSFRSAAIRRILEQMRSAIQNTARSIEYSMRGTLYNGTDSICNAIDSRIEAVFNNLCSSMSNYAVENGLKVTEQMIRKVADAARHALIGEIRRAIRQSAEENVIAPIANGIDHTITSTLTNYLDSIVGRNLYSLSGASRQPVYTEQIAQQTAAMIGSLTINTIRSIDLTNGIQNISRFAEEAYRNISWKNIYDNMIRELTGSSAEDFAERYIKTQMVNGATMGATALLGSEAGSVVNQLGQNIELDFSNLGEKIRKGQVGKIIRFDPSYIHVRTKIADFEGWVEMTEDDPLWGDSWQGRFNVAVKMKPSFSVDAIYINGTKTGASGNEFEYWFVEINARGLNLPMTPVPLIFDGAGGKLFHHMRYNIDGENYLPNEEIDYGAGLRVFLADIASFGRTFYIDMNAEVAWGNDVLDFTLKGGAYVLNKMNSGTLEKSFLEGTGVIHYSTDKKELITNITIVVNGRPFYCGRGTLEIYISPTTWHIFFGTQSSPISIDLLCANIISFDGYLNIAKTYASAGLRKEFMIGGETGWTDLNIGRFNAYANTGCLAEAGCTVSWEDELTIESAYFGVNVSTVIGLKYECAGTSGSLEYSNTPISGSLLYESKPTNKITGEVTCKVTLLSVDIGCSLKVSKTFN